MNRRHKNPLARCGLTAIVFLASLLLVLSFIFFEVLDVDGSDLPRRLKPGPHAATVEDWKPDIRRAALAGPSYLISIPPSFASLTPVSLAALRPTVRVGFRPAAGIRCRPLLARAALGDPSASLS